MRARFLALLAIAMLSFQVGCKKDVYVPELTKKQILTQKTWRVDKLHHVIDGKYASYVWGGENTTGVDYDKLRFTFKADGTGTHVTADGINHPLVWAFTTSDQREMEITAVKATYTWQMVEIEGKYLHASVNINLTTGSDNVETFRLIQVP